MTPESIQQKAEELYPVQKVAIPGYDGFIDNNLSARKAFLTGYTFAQSEAVRLKDTLRELDKAIENLWGKVVGSEELNEALVRLGKEQNAAKKCYEK